MEINHDIQLTKILLNYIRNARREFQRIMQEEPVITVTPERLNKLSQRLEKVFEHAEKLERERLKNMAKQRSFLKK